MGFFSKLLKSIPPSAPPAPEEARAEPIPSESIPTPVMMPVYVPPDARPTPPDAFDRPTMRQLEPFSTEERVTVVAPEPTIAALAKASTAAPASGTKAPPLPASRNRPPPAPIPSAPASPGSAPRPPIARAQPNPAPTRDKPLKPPVPTPRPTTKAASAFDATSTDTGPKTASAPGSLEVDLTEVQSLFGQLAVNHMRQVRDFLIELRWGPTPAMWVALCEPSVASLLRAAETMELAALSKGLRGFADAMRAVDVASATTIEGSDRERILAAHAVLEEVLPETFKLDGARSQREAAILHALLSQIPEVHKVTIDKLYGAGLTTLEMMFLARTDDLVATTGIPETLAARIVERFVRYREEIANGAIDETRAHERAAIASLVDELRRQNDAFDQATAGWTPEALQRKKDVLLARGRTMLEIDLHLARLGEIELVRELERLPFARKVIALDTFLAEANKRYATVPRSTPRRT
jgi:hypothetical protein